MKDGIEDDCDKCAIALAGKRQLRAPLCRIGKAFAYVAMPDQKGVTVPGHGKTKWSVFAYQTMNMTAQTLIKDNDTGKPEDEGVTVTLAPRRKSERAAGKAAKNARNPKRVVLGTHPQRGRKKPVREEGVRNYSGRVWV
jgi:hypothetical protein